MKKKIDTSWGNVAGWYGDYLEKDDTYQSKVILPNLMRVLDLKKDENVLDLACGQGFFTSQIHNLGAHITGVDISSELIKEARKNVPVATFHVTSASSLTFANNGQFDVVFCVLALQNMEDLSSVFKEVFRVLKPEGRFIFVINHPTFRVLRESSWGWDEEKKVQYRRIDKYLSSAKILINMNPGKENTVETVSYHRSLQDFFKALNKSGFVVARLEEWISHKVSGKGPRQKSEDISRKEIPLFMAMECMKKSRGN